MTSQVPVDSAVGAVNELVLAVRKALLSGARATDADATGALTEMCNHSVQATRCVDSIRQALLRASSPIADAGMDPVCGVIAELVTTHRAGSVLRSGP